MAKDDYLHIRIERDLLDRIDQAAADVGRTRSNFVLYILDQYLAHQELALLRDSPAPPPPAPRPGKPGPYRKPKRKKPTPLKN